MLIYLVIIASEDNSIGISFECIKFKFNFSSTCMSNFCASDPHPHPPKATQISLVNEPPPWKNFMDSGMYYVNQQQALTLSHFHGKVSKCGYIER